MSRALSGPRCFHPALRWWHVNGCSGDRCFYCPTCEISWVAK